VRCFGKIVCVRVENDGKCTYAASEVERSAYENKIIIILCRVTIMCRVYYNNRTQGDPIVIARRLTFLNLTQSKPTCRTVMIALKAIREPHPSATVTATLVWVRRVWVREFRVVSCNNVGNHPVYDVYT